MKVLIKSNQIFEEHVESVEEVHDCKLTFLEEGFELIYDDTIVKAENNILYVNRANMFLKIEEKKVNVSSMKTPYGDIEIKVSGEFIKWFKNPFGLTARYKLGLGESTEYANELQILVIEE